MPLENNYVKPSINEEGYYKHKRRKTPCCRKKLYQRENLYLNDTLLNKEDNQLLLITGPNMAGKSTYMRQVALITLMATNGFFLYLEVMQISLYVIRYLQE